MQGWARSCPSHGTCMAQSWHSDPQSQEPINVSLCSVANPSIRSILPGQCEGPWGNLELTASNFPPPPNTGLALRPGDPRPRLKYIRSAWAWLLCRGQQEGHGSILCICTGRMARGIFSRGLIVPPGLVPRRVWVHAQGLSHPQCRAPRASCHIIPHPTPPTALVSVAHELPPSHAAAMQPCTAQGKRA